MTFSNILILKERLNLNCGSYSIKSGLRVIICENGYKIIYKVSFIKMGLVEISFGK